MKKLTFLFIIFLGVSLFKIQNVSASTLPKISLCAPPLIYTERTRAIDSWKDRFVYPEIGEDVQPNSCFYNSGGTDGSIRIEFYDPDGILIYNETFAAKDFFSVPGGRFYFYPIFKWKWTNPAKAHLKVYVIDNITGSQELQIDTDFVTVKPTYDEIVEVGVKGLVWYHWKPSVSSDKAILVFLGSGGYSVLYDPFEYYTPKESFVLDLVKRGYHVYSPATMWAGTFYYGPWEPISSEDQTDPCYYKVVGYRDRSNHLTEAIKNFSQTYDKIFLFGFSYGGEIVIFENEKDFYTSFPKLKGIFSFEGGFPSQICNKDKTYFCDGIEIEPGCLKYPLCNFHSEAYSPKSPVAISAGRTSSTDLINEMINYYNAIENKVPTEFVWFPDGHDPFNFNAEDGKTLSEHVDEWFTCENGTSPIDNLCYKTCGASLECEGKSPNTKWCDGNTKKVCDSNCQYSFENCRTDAEDTDGGQNYSRYGVCYDYSGCENGECKVINNPDKCYSSNILLESYPSGSICAYTSYNCGSGYYCSGGRCTSGGGGGGGGCPFLKVWDGEKFVNLGKLNIHAPKGIDKILKTSFTMEPIEKGKYKVILKEASYWSLIEGGSEIDFVSLEEKNGKECKLISASHSIYGDILKFLKESDNLRIKIKPNEEIVLIYEGCSGNDFNFIIEGYNPLFWKIPRPMSIIEAFRSFIEKIFKIR
jgi:dienelactone hydrolase